MHWHFCHPPPANRSRGQLQGAMNPHEFPLQLAHFAVKKRGAGQLKQAQGATSRGFGGGGNGSGGREDNDMGGGRTGFFRERDVVII